MYEKVIGLKRTGHWGRRLFRFKITSLGFTYKIGSDIHTNERLA
jgi:hypothetical protein